VAGAAAAEHLVQFQEGGLSGASSGAVTYTPTAPPQAFAFSFYGSTRAQAHQVFCQGVWFALAARAFEVTDCDPRPIAADLALSLAQRQYRVAGGSA
jgi:hypothetical protein